MLLFHTITQLMHCVQLFQLHIQHEAIGIPTSGIFILESTVGPTNTTHQLNNVMFQVGNTFNMSFVVLNPRREY